MTTNARGGSAALRRLWAPWRSSYLSQQGTRRCFLCAATASRADRAHLVIARAPHVFAILNRYPYNNGHLMIAPYRHIGSLGRLRADEWAGLLAMSQQLIGRLKRTLRAQGFNIGFNLGRVGGAGVPGHLHLHLVPRWNGDTNFMPLLAETKVISQSLDELYTLLSVKGRAARHAALT